MGRTAKMRSRSVGFHKEHEQEGSRRINSCSGFEWLTMSRVLFTALIAAISVFGGVQGAEAACSNETLRAGQSATFLPDCRAYELVSPSEGEPYLIGGSHNTYGVRASTRGGGIAWFSFYPLSTSLGGEFHSISTREEHAGWTTEAVGPRLTPTNSGFSECEPLMFFSADLSTSLLTDGRHSSGPGQMGEGECPGNDPALVPNEPEGFQNVFVRKGATDEYALANVTPEGVRPADAWFQGASDDFSHVVFEENAKLTETAPAGASLYEWISGAVSLVSVLPDGKTTVGTIPGAVVGGGNLEGASLITHSVSDEGKRVVFEAEGKLFLREIEQSSEEDCPKSANACTVQLDASDSGGPGGSGSFLAANATGTEIFFTDGPEAKLTADTAPGSGRHLYEYNTQTQALNDLTPTGELGLLGLSGIGGELSDSGSEESYLYVVARAGLAEGATVGQPNLYVFHEGTAEFIATLGEGDREDVRDWTPEELTARVSPNGRHIAFSSIERLTGYDNTPLQPKDCLVQFIATGTEPGPCLEIFLYNVGQSKPDCVSCVPNGSRPTGPAEIPRAEASNPGPGPGYVQRNVLDDGRVFFDTADELLPRAGNDVSNVYEYENGQLSLISTGTSGANSFFYDASPSGGDLFFVTTQHLVRGDTGNGVRLYDARVGGGFPESEVPVQCSGEGCIAATVGMAPLPPLLTASLQGTGNQVPVHRKAIDLTRKQKLKRALRACQRKKKPQSRAACRKKARQRYAIHAASVRREGDK